MNRHERRAERARCMSIAWRKANPDQVPAGFTGPAGRKKALLATDPNKYAIALQFTGEVVFRWEPYRSAYLATLLTSREPITATMIAAGVARLIHLAVPADVMVDPTNRAGSIIKALGRTLERNDYAEINWLFASSFAIRKLVDAHHRDDVAASREWLALLSHLGWKEFMEHLAVRLRGVARSNIPPDADDLSARALKLLGWLERRVQKKQSVAHQI